MNPSHTHSSSYHTTIIVRKSLLSHRHCLQPLKGSTFGECITEISFDPSLVPPDAVKVLAAVFPGVRTLSWSTSCASRLEDNHRLLSMSLFQAVVDWPCLSYINVGSVTGGVWYCADDDLPTFDQVKSTLLPPMLYMRASMRPLTLALSDPQGYSNAGSVEKMKTLWMAVREELECWNRIGDLRVTIKPAG